MTYLKEMDQDNGLLYARDVLSKGIELAKDYASAYPFPHIIIDDFLPNSVLDMCLDAFPTHMDAGDKRFDIPQEKLKTSYNPERLKDNVRILFYSFNSRPFLKIIENITGIKGLIPDPYFMGGGFHELQQGGHLSIHADFNHHTIMDLERRVNVLIYLNKDWQNDYGGQLELWENDMSKAVHSIVPSFNRCVIFNTTSRSNHGNPNPIAHPIGASRKSIALYYYTATWKPESKEHTTVFQVRPKSDDTVDWSAKFKEIALDFVPPVLARKLRGKKAKILRQRREG